MHKKYFKRKDEKDNIAYLEALVAYLVNTNNTGHLEALN